jgi:hypothetical protein
MHIAKTARRHNIIAVTLLLKLEAGKEKQPLAAKDANFQES